MNRGEVWWMAAPPPPRRSGGRHMVVLLSWDAPHTCRDRITVAPITSTIRKLDAEVPLDHADGVQHACVINLDVIATVFRTSLEERVVQLSDQRMSQVNRAIHRALGMPLPCTS